MSAKFTATIEHGPRGGAFVVIPDATRSRLKLGGRSKVAATFDGTPYRGSVFSADGTLVLGITKKIRCLIGKDIGDTVDVTLEIDTTPRTVETPPDLKEALGKHPKAAARYEALAFTYRKEFAKWITDAKKMETRERRLRKAIQMIVDGQKL